MKKILILLMTGLILVACNNDDAKSGNKHSEAKTDTTAGANVTTIEWLDSTSRNLGTIKKGQTVEIVYTLRNTGDKPLVIKDTKAQCGCTVAEAPKQPIAPGETGKIRAEFNTTNQHGSVEKTITITANTKPETINLSFHGEVKEK